MCWSGLIRVLLAGLNLAIAGVVSPAQAADGSWDKLAPMPTAREGIELVTAADGRIFAIGGEASDRNGSRMVNTVEAYSSSTNTWPTVTPMPTARTDVAAVAGRDGRIYAIGGYDILNGAYLDVVEAYTVSTDTWTASAPLPSLHEPITAVAMPDGRIIAVGKTVIESYTPGSDRWEPVLPISPPVSGAVAALGSDGRLYVFGGAATTGIASTPLAAAYTLADKTVHPTAPPPSGFGILAAVGSSDGHVYAIGGSYDRRTNRYSDVLETYTIATDQWSVGPYLPTGRANVAATVGSDGRVYVAGGLGSTGEVAEVDVDMPISKAAGEAVPACRFILGFRTLHALIPGAVGDCADNEQHNASNGDAIQHTCNGLLAWRKVDNFTAFTDGYRTWVNSPYGVQERLNTQRFRWEANPNGLPIVP